MRGMAEKRKAPYIKVRFGVAFANDWVHEQAKELARRQHRSLAFVARDPMEKGLAADCESCERARACRNESDYAN